MNRPLKVPGWLRPSRTIPVTPWRSASRWRARPPTLGVLILGLALFGTGEALLVVAALGNGPWTVFAQGLTVHTPMSIGLATFVLSVIVLLLWIPLRERPGLGTIANAVIIAVALQIGVQVIPSPSALWLRLLFVIGGIALIGLGSGLYLTTNLGPGPRDGWMTGLHVRFGWPVARVRTGIEVSVVVIGWLLGGTVGLGTVLFALFVGPSVGWGLRLMNWGDSAPEAGAPGLEA